MNNKLSGLFSNARTKYIIMTAAVLILLAGAYFAWKTYFRENPQLVKWNETTAAASTQTSTFDLSTVKIEPVTSDSAGVDTKSAFKLYCDAGLTPETIQAALRVTPERAYSLEKVSRGEYNISFKDELTGNSVYKLEMTDSSSGSKRSWAFQTKRSFSVVRTLPRNQATQVPVDSGIEITFSQENAESLENYFEISPKVEGRFETHKKTIVFVPKQLEPGTIYTVTIKKGIGFSGSTDKLAEDYSFSFQTTVKEPEEIRLQFSFTNELYNFTAKATPALQVYADSTLNNTDADLELYKYQDEALFEADMKAYDLTPRWALRESTEVPASLEKLQKLQISKAKIVEHQEKYNLQTYLLLPDTLEEGSYLVKASVGGDTVYTWLQISNSVAYIMVANNKTIAWVNDSVTGKPLQNAVITSDYYPSAKTDATGIARLDGALDKPDAANLYFKLSVEGRPDFIARVSQNAYPYYMAGSYYYGGNSSNSTNIYWTYQYLDKDVYLPTDRINIWGVVKKRDGSALDAGNTQAGAVLELTRSDYYNDFYYTEGGSKTVIDSKEVEISPNGTYTGSFSLEAYNPGSYNVSLKVNGEIVSGNYIQIMEYVKPAYKLELTPDKKAVFAGDKVNLGIQASFFEGSPLPGLKLNYSTGVSSNSPKEGQVTCDNNGYYSLTLPTETAITSWRPQSLFAELSSANAEETDIRAYTYLNVFPRDTMFEASGKIEKGMAIVDFKTNLIDLTRLNEEGDYNWDSELYRGAAVDKALSVRLIETHYEAE
ncbi:MAG: hypothetical protein HGA22_00550, partial [Clostridiales bacterium]|nr:hypothetical protein [Clostridiales bacterium]